MLTIKILGSGCSTCAQLESAVKAAVAGLDADAAVVKVTDYAEMMRYGMLAPPGLVVNERLVSSGRIPSSADLTTYITTGLAETS